MLDNLFEKYHQRIAKEGFLKAFLVALSIGSGVLAISTFLSWFFGFEAGLWVSLALFVAVTGGLVPIFYFFKFRPTTKAIARRVDELGLEERVITMTELEKDTSYIAQRQREDTVQALGRVNHMLLKIVVSTALIVVVAAVGLLGIGMTTVDTLYVAGLIPSGINSIAEAKGEKSYTVLYGVDEDGTGTVVYYNEDNWFEMVEFVDAIEVTEGEKAPAVIAFPAADYVFVEWSDGLRNPYRADTVMGDIDVVAIFEPIDDLLADDPELDDPDGDGPGDPGGGEGPSNPSMGDISDPNGESGGDEGGGNRNYASGTIINGDYFYGDDYDNAYNEAMDRLGSDDELSDEQKSLIDDYFESIKSGKN